MDNQVQNNNNESGYVRALSLSNRFIIYYGLNNPNLDMNRDYPNNRIQTTKYSIITWAPKSLIMQFKRAANIYFLIVTILTFLSFSPVEPASMIATFIFVLACTMVKEAIEDYGRYLQDKATNNRLVWKYDKSGWVKTKCWTLLPGDIIKVEKDEEFSADTLVIKSSNEHGYGFIETKSLDGETNLKEKAALEAFRHVNENEYMNIQGYVECERPNENLSQWNGKLVPSQGFINKRNNNNNHIHHNGDNEEDEMGEDDEDNAMYCKMNHLILKGCVLKNTAYVCGIVIYSGKNTKIMKNSKSARFKMSKVLNTMNKLLYSVFIFEIALCVVFGYLCLNWNSNKLVLFLLPLNTIAPPLPPSPPSGPPFATPLYLIKEVIPSPPSPDLMYIYSLSTNILSPNYFTLFSHKLFKGQISHLGFLALQILRPKNINKW
jgi:magnesium-transporting ATPase (P-type)